MKSELYLVGTKSRENFEVESRFFEVLNVSERFRTFESSKIPVKSLAKSWIRLQSFDDFRISSRDSPEAIFKDPRTRIRETRFENLIKIFPVGSRVCQIIDTISIYRRFIKLRSEAEKLRGGGGDKLVKLSLWARSASLADVFPIPSYRSIPDKEIPSRVSRFNGHRPSLSRAFELCTYQKLKITPLGTASVFECDRANSPDILKFTKNLRENLKLYTVCTFPRNETPSKATKTRKIPKS